MEIIKPPRGVQLDKSHPLNRGLVAFWLFNEGDGKKVFDLSGNGNHGTLQNMAFPPTATSGWNAGRKGVGLQFDGSDDYVDCGNDASLDITGNITIAAWVKLATTPITYSEIVCKEGVTYGYSFIVHSDRKVQFWIGDGGDWAGVQDATTVLQDDVWYHIVGINNGTNIKVYVNGIKEGSNVPQPNPASTTGNMVIGVKGDLLTRWFNGIIDQVRIYNRALSAEEIKTLYLYPYGK